MPKPTKSETVPEPMRAKFEEITRLTNDFCKAHLNDEYAQLCRYLAAALCRKRPSPLTSGKANTWACGIVHAIGTVNFLFDSSQKPHMKATEIYQLFGVGQSTGQGKSKQIREVMKMHQMDPNWSLPSMLDRNPMAWLISVNGYIIDASPGTASHSGRGFSKRDYSLPTGRRLITALFFHPPVGL